MISELREWVEPDGKHMFQRAWAEPDADLLTPDGGATLFLLSLPRLSITVSPKTHPATRQLLVPVTLHRNAAFKAHGRRGHKSLTHMSQS